MKKIKITRWIFDKEGKSIYGQDFDPKEEGDKVNSQPNVSKFCHSQQVAEWDNKSEIAQPHIFSAISMFPGGKFIAWRLTHRWSSPRCQAGRIYKCIVETVEISKKQQKMCNK